ncbi:MAG: hypothetical protein M1365_03270 [Actinobacteria bacterium]|nr:hypothetical protein [Actinomycetota bacterium]
MINENFVILGTLMGTIGGLSYLVYTIQGKVKPNRVTYLFWALAPLIAFAAQIKEGVGIQSLFTFSAGFLPLMVFLASFFNKKAEWKITKFDLICGCLSLIGLSLWALTQIGNLAIFFSIIADGLAGVPTVIKSFKHPETESGWNYLTASISSVVVLLTITNWTFASYSFSIYLFTINFIIFIFAQFKFGKVISKDSDIITS